ncbi:MAG: hypothetical protein ACLTWK_12065 [Eisenbergiella sp.]
MEMLFNPNELAIERIRSVEEYDITTDELTGRFTQVKEPSLNLTSEESPVTDAMGSRIATFYNAQSGTFSFNNAVFSTDLLASQFGSKKQVATSENKIAVPVSEIVTIGSDHTAQLKYVPVGTNGAEIKYVKLYDGKTFGNTLTITSGEVGEGKFTLDAAKKTITVSEGVTGKLFVSYVKESENAILISKSTDSVPGVKKLIINVIFHNVCDTNIVYSGKVICYRAQIDPTNIEISLTTDGGHAASYILQKEYCEEDGKLIDFIVDKD